VIIWKLIKALVHQTQDLSAGLALYAFHLVTQDHVVIDHHLTARDAHVLDAGTSDHRPVVVTIGPR
jgi:endonuclease/exonuclease/phosphatase family metal-dependent hydrolase